MADERHTGRGPHRIDWDAAEAFYLTTKPRAYRKVGEQFSVSESMVARIGRRRGWPEKAAALDAQALAAAEPAILRSREQQVAQTARIRDRAADRIEKRLGETTMDDNDVLRALEWGEKNVRLNLGESTEHVAIAEVQGLLAAHLRATAPFVSKDDREAWLAAMEDATSGLLALGERSAA